MKRFLLILFSVVVLSLGVRYATVLSQSASSFVDLYPEHPHFEAINYVQAQNIVKGYEDGTFRPQASINRAEFMKIVVEAVVGQAPLEHAGQCFSDVASGVWYYPYICYAERVGIVSGYPDGSFRPANNISFVEAAKIIAIAFESGATEDTELWYRNFVQYLAEQQAIPIEVVSFDQELTRGQMAEIIYRLHAEVSNKNSRDFTDLEAAYAVNERWERQLFPEWGFSMMLPPYSNELSHSDQESYRRFQNYSDKVDLLSLAKGQYYLEIHADEPRDCQEEVSNAQEEEVDGILVTRGMGAGGGDAGGHRFALCFNFNAWGFLIQVTENNSDGPIANAILDSFTFQTTFTE